VEMAGNGGGGGDVHVKVDDAALRKAYTQSELRYLKIQVRGLRSIFASLGRWLCHVESRIGGRRSGGRASSLGFMIAFFV
jgi:hypothetical protein